MVTGMVENTQELHNTKVCNSTELHNQKSCNCFATGDATTMQQSTIKSRALAVLRRNKPCNSHATATESLCNKPCNNQPKVASRVALITDDKQPHDLHRLVGEALAEVDLLGRPWPARFLADLSAEDRGRLREIERSIDTAVLGGDAPTLRDLLNEWRDHLQRHFN